VHPCFELGLSLIKDATSPSSFLYQFLIASGIPFALMSGVTSEKPPFKGQNEVLQTTQFSMAVVRSTPRANKARLAGAVRTPIMCTD
jgi:hypothetical protein